MNAAELSIDAAVREMTVALATGAAPTMPEQVATADALHRVLAADVVSPLDLPAFDNAAMDGYALRAADLAPRAPLREIGRALAGHGYPGTVVPGTCVRTMTGAPLPAGADTVVMMEHVTAGADGIRIDIAPPPGANVRLQGEHIARGAMVLTRGQRLAAADIGLAASVGHAQLAVAPRLRVGCLSTGDELADPPQTLGPAGSYDANRPFLLAMLQELGFEAIDCGICPDRSEAFEVTLRRAFELRLDALLISGGAAQGDADIVRQAGGIRFLPLAFRPGRGIAFAALARGARRLALLGLPGNAVAAFVMFQLVARPVLFALAGARAAEPLRLRLPLAGEVQHRGGHIDYWRARFSRDVDGTLRVAPLPAQGSAMLRTVAEADALIAVGPQRSYRAGDLVDTIPLSSLG